MKILHFIYDDIDNPWLGGGGAVRTYEIYKRLAKTHEITVITGNYLNAKKEEEKEGVLYKRIGTCKNYFLSRLSYSIESSKQIITSDYDIVVEDFSGYSPCFSPLYTKKPVIASIQNLYGSHTFKKYGIIGIPPFIFEKIGLTLYRNFIAVSPSIRSQLENKISKDCNIKIIPNGVDDSLFLLEPSEKNYILFLGRIDIYQKGIDLLLKAFSKVAQNHRDIELVIAGRGKDEDKLKNIILDLDLDIRLLGRVSDTDRIELLSNCLFVCMPSRYEAWPMVATESAACEKPVIGANIPGLWDIIKDNETGLLIDTNIDNIVNVDKLVEGMNMLIENRDIRKELGKNARNFARDFNWDNIAQEQEKFYLEILRNSR